MKKLVDVFKKSDVNKVWLEVRHKNASAFLFYSGLGFEVIGVRKKYYSDTGEDALVMLKEI
jgi:[ribosomal protein S18]-alanine N-acetyltransferase